MRQRPTRAHQKPETYRSGEYPAVTPFLAARAVTGAVDRYLGARRELAEYFTRAAAAQPDPGVWIHVGCGGELVRLQGVDRPVCRRCGRTVR